MIVMKPLVTMQPYSHEAVVSRMCLSQWCSQKRPFRLAALMVTLLASMGCGHTQRGAVSGKITLDGQPVDSGRIEFTPIGARARESSWAEVVGGQYSIPASRGPATGPNIAAIYWPKKTGRVLPAMPPAGPVDEAKEAIPDRYNRQSELRADVKSGHNQFDFTLHSR